MHGPLHDCTVHFRGLPSASAKLYPALSCPRDRARCLFLSSQMALGSSETHLDIDETRTSKDDTRSKSCIDTRSNSAILLSAASFDPTGPTWVSCASAQTPARVGASPVSLPSPPLAGFLGLPRPLPAAVPRLGFEVSGAKASGSDFCVGSIFTVLSPGTSRARTC